MPCCEKQWRAPIWKCFENMKSTIKMYRARPLAQEPMSHVPPGVLNGTCNVKSLPRGEDKASQGRAAGSLPSSLRVGGVHPASSVSMELWRQGGPHWLWEEVAATAGEGKVLST